ncbi:TPA: restriction endonuclease subunit S [Serratia marcescens]|nr:restriction endonuclease subunit S [Serratia marcescens]HEJ8055459.1 restriction endonuclease subunit S [Serratia marcescens]
MTKYKAYPEYKNSGLSWCDTLPLRWKTSRLRWLSYIYAGGTPSKNVTEYWDNGTIPWINSGSVNQGYIIEPSEYISKGAYKNSSAKWIPKGSLVLALAGQGKTKGMVAQLGIDTTCNQSMAAIVFYERSQSRYIYWWLVSNYQNIRNMSGGDLRDGLNLEILGDIACPQPSMNESHKIASFLDHETAKIDKLIEKQQQLIELLKEKRQAVISHAVTKGLNPDVPMKDSGVEWLGEVPEHWRVSRVKNFAKIESGHTPSKTKSEYWVNCIIPWVSLNDSKQLKDVDYIEDTTYKISELGMANSSAHLLPARAVVFTRDASIGLSAITTKPMAVSQHLIAWLCNERFVVPEFLLLVFYAMEKEFERYTFGATIKTIGMDNVRGLRSAFPPIDEQHKLIEWAFKKLEKIKFSINKVEDIISLLQERRTALISAAVTGKIDVRDWVAPDMQDAEEPQETTA